MIYSLIALIKFTIIQCLKGRKSAAAASTLASNGCLTRKSKRQIPTGKFSSMPAVELAASKDAVSFQ